MFVPLARDAWLHLVADHAGSQDLDTDGYRAVLRTLANTAPRDQRRALLTAAALSRQAS